MAPYRINGTIDFETRKYVLARCMINISIKCRSYASQLCHFLFSLITSLFDSLRHGNIYICIYICARVCVWRATHRDPIVGGVDFHIMKFRKANKPSTEPILIYIYSFRWWHIYTYMYIVYIDGVSADISIWQWISLFGPQCIGLHISYLIFTNYTRIRV